MSVEALAVVLHHSPTSSTDKLVLLGIANHDGDGGAYPSVATLAKYANVSERGVQKCLQRLAMTGQIRIHLQDGGQRDARYRTNRYEILVRCPEGCDGSTNHRVRDERQDTPDSDSRGEPQDTPDDPGVNAGALRDVLERALGVNPSSPEPSLEPSLEPTDDDTRQNYSRGSSERHLSSSSDFDAVVRVLARLALSNARKAGTHIGSETGWLKGTRGNIADEQQARICDLMRDGLTVPEIAYEMIPDRSLARWAMRQEGVAHLSEVAS